MAKTEPLLTLGFAAISWIEHFLVHGPGDVQGQEIELDDEFAAFIVKGYRLNKNGSRRVRRAFLSRSKGRSKSGLAGFIACFEALGPARFDHFAEEGEVSDWGYEYAAGEPVGRPLTYAEILCVATEEGQAGNTYDGIYFMLHHETCSDALLATYGRLDVGLTRINLPDKRGFIEPVTAANESKDGGKSTFIVADETHLWIPPMTPGAKFKLGKMHQTMVRNLLKRKVASGWMLETSTMYAAGERSVAEGTHAYAKTMGGRDGKLLFDHRQASDEWNLEKRSERLSALKEAYGPAAAWMDLQAIADYWDDPQATHADFRRFWLNQPVPLVEAPVSVMPNWANLGSTNEVPPVSAIGVAVDVDRVWAAIGAASVAEGSTPYVGPVVMREAERSRVPLTETVELEDGHRVPLVVSEAARIQREQGCVIVVDHKGPAGSLEDDFAKAGATVLWVGLEEKVNAVAALFDAVESGQLEHGNDPDLNAAVAAAGWRKVGLRRLWSNRNGNVVELDAVTLALYGANQTTDIWEVWT